MSLLQDSFFYLGGYMKKIFILIITITFIFMLSSCTVQDEPGFKVGFNRDHGSYLEIGASSDIDIHKKGSEKITLYYGIGESYYEIIKNDRFYFVDVGEMISIVIIMYNECDYLHLADHVRECEDYYNIENTYFVKEILIEDLLTRKYNVEYLNSSELKYNVSEELCIPQELLKGESGRIKIDIFITNFTKTNDKYFLVCEDSISLKYYKSDNETIMIKEG